MSEHYQPETNLHTIERLRGHVRMHLQTVDLKPAEWQRVILMEILLHIYDKLESIDHSLQLGYRNEEQREEEKEYG